MKIILENHSFSTVFEVQDSGCSASQIKIKAYEKLSLPARIAICIVSLFAVWKWFQSDFRKDFYDAVNCGLQKIEEINLDLSSYKNPEQVLDHIKRAGNLKKISEEEFNAITLSEYALLPVHSSFEETKKALSGFLLNDEMKVLFLRLKDELIKSDPHYFDDSINKDSNISDNDDSKAFADNNRISYVTWGCTLSESQRKKIDFSRLTQDQYEEIFLFADGSFFSNSLNRLSPVQLKDLLVKINEWFPEEYLAKNVALFSCEYLNFTKLAPSLEDVAELFPDNELGKTRFQSLSHENVNVIFDKLTFQLNYLLPDQINTINFLNQKIQLSSILQLKLLLEKIIEWFPEEYLAKNAALFSCEYLDFAKIDLSQQDINELFPDDELGKIRFQSLSHENVNIIFDKLTFQLKHLLPEQLEGVDLSNLTKKQYNLIFVDDQKHFKINPLQELSYRQLLALFAKLSDWFDDKERYTKVAHALIKKLSPEQVNDLNFDIIGIDSNDYEINKRKKAINNWVDRVKVSPFYKNNEANRAQFESILKWLKPEKFDCDQINSAFALVFQATSTCEDGAVLIVNQLNVLKSLGNSENISLTELKKIIIGAHRHDFLKKHITHLCEEANLCREHLGQRAIDEVEQILYAEIKLNKGLDLHLLVDALYHQNSIALNDIDIEEIGEEVLKNTADELSILLESPFWIKALEKTKEYQDFHNLYIESKNKRYQESEALQDKVDVLEKELDNLSVENIERKKELEDLIEKKNEELNEMNDKIFNEDKEIDRKHEENKKKLYSSLTQKVLEIKFSIELQHVFVNL